jgi:hypothetical protein
MSKTYKTLTGFHFLGQTEHSGTIRDLLSDGHIPMVAKFVQCDVGYIAGLHGSFPDDTAFIARWVTFGAWNSDNIDGWLAAHPNVASAALAWVDLLTPNLTALASLPRTVYVETFNEAEITPNLCAFNVSVAKLLKARYGEELKIAALSLGAGRYNERNQAQLIIDNLIRPLNALDIQYALSLHAYSSLAMPIWNGLGYYKHNVQEMYATGDPSKAIDLDTIPRVSFDAEPGAYTGFAHERLGYFLKVLSAPGERLHETPIFLTETGIDAMQDPGIGTVAGGWREWWERHLWDRVLRNGEAPGAYMARNLAYAEGRYRAANAAGMNIQGATPFTYSDADPFSRWFKDYRLVGDAWNLFKERAKANAINAPIPEPEEWMTCNVVSTATPSLNVRSKPGTEGTILGRLLPGAKAEAIAQIKNAKDETWIKIKYSGVTSVYPDAWVLATLVRLEGCTAPLPTWGGTTPPNHTPPVPEPPTPPVIDLAVLKTDLEQMQGTIQVLRGQSDAILAKIGSQVP